MNLPNRTSGTQGMRAVASSRGDSRDRNGPSLDRSPGTSYHPQLAQSQRYPHAMAATVPKAWPWPEAGMGSLQI